MKNQILLAIVLVFGILIFGCVGTKGMPGSDKDSHGCIGSAGYAWCEVSQKCIKPWEENCTDAAATILGGDKDEHGCIGSAGYTWCEETKKCIRPWEETCPETTQLANPASVKCEKDGGKLTIVDTQEGQIGICQLKNGELCEEWAYYRGECPVLVGGDKDAHGCIGSAGYTWCEVRKECIRPWEQNCTMTQEEYAKKFCGQPYVQKVFTCGEYIRVVSTLVGGGSIFYINDTEYTQCPVVGEEALRIQCRQLLYENNCVQTQIC